MSDPRGVVAELSAASWGLAALGAASELGVPAALDAPRTAAEVAARCGLPEPLTAALLDVLVAVGLAAPDGDGRVAATHEGLDGVLSALLPELHGAIHQPAELHLRARAGGPWDGWAHTDDAVLQAQGDASAQALDLLDRRVFPALDGVPERLEDGPRLLDVGAGVAALSIAMCRRWPTMTVVALEPQDAPLRLARANVAAAGLGDRIDVRQAVVQALEEEAAFDLVWLPATFLPPAVLPVAVGVAHRALCPGGWLLTATLGGSGSDLPAAAARLRAVLWGGGLTAPDTLEALLRDAGFADVRGMPRLPSGLQPLFARRAPHGPGA